MHSLCAMLSYFTGKALGAYITVQCHSASLAHARPTMFYIPLIVYITTTHEALGAQLATVWKLTCKAL